MFLVIKLNQLLYIRIAVGKYSRVLYERWAGQGCPYVQAIVETIRFRRARGWNAQRSRYGHAARINKYLRTVVLVVVVSVCVCVCFLYTYMVCVCACALKTSQHFTERGWLAFFCITQLSLCEITSRHSLALSFLLKYISRLMRV